MIKEKILHLTLKKKWFDMIKLGLKTEEYRDIKPYWISRLSNNTVNQFEDYLALGTDECVDFKHYTHIVFSNGYSKDRPMFKIEIKDIGIISGKEEWGAVKNVAYIGFNLGGIVD